MVRDQIAARGIEDERVISAMARVPRHRFAEGVGPATAYGDHPLPIGSGQTISQPYIVAYMTEALRLPPAARVLEIGTGSGYQTAVLAEIAAEVFTIEYRPELLEKARERLAALGYENIRFREGDGREGWPVEAPFHGIVVTAAPEEGPPPPLLDQLAPGGRLVVPVGKGDQVLMRYTKNEQGGISSERLLAVRFVPLV